MIRNRLSPFLPIANSIMGPDFAITDIERPLILNSFGSTPWFSNTLLESRLSQNHPVLTERSNDSPFRIHQVTVPNNHRCDIGSSFPIVVHGNSAMGHTSVQYPVGVRSHDNLCHPSSLSLSPRNGPLILAINILGINSTCPGQLHHQLQSPY